MSEVIGFVPPITRPPAVLPIGRDRIWRRRSLKFGVALALLSAGGYAVLSGQGYVTSDNAVVSAYTVSLRTPISGYVSDLRTKVGDPVAAGMVLARLTEPRVDDQRLVDLENLFARFRNNRQAYEHEKAELSRQHDALVARAGERNQSEAVYLMLQAAESERQVHLQEAAQYYARRDFKRKAALGRMADASTAEVDKSRSAAAQADMNVEAAIARHAYLLLQAEVAQKGILLESGSADVPYSSQRADELAVRLAEIDREIAYLAASEAETSARLDAEHHRLDLLRGADLVAPSPGMLWKLGASDGERLAVSDTVAEMVDCRSAFIIAAIPQDRFSDVEIGSTARVRLSGETMGRVGRVVSLTGEASLANDRNLAATPPLQRVATATARIEVAASTNSARDCLVGRTARVLLPTSADSGLLAGIARRFF
jgi:multidrug resistance efflux pump